MRKPIGQKGTPSCLEPSDCSWLVLLLTREQTDRVATGLPVFAEAVFDRLARIIFAHSGILVLDVEGDDLAQARDFLL